MSEQLVVLHGVAPQMLLGSVKLILRPFLANFLNLLEGRVASVTVLSSPLVLQQWPHICRLIFLRS